MMKLNPGPRREQAATSGPVDAAASRLVPDKDLELHTWFERDRAHVELRHGITELTVVEWWDEMVDQAMADGILSGGKGPRIDEAALKSSVVEHAASLGLLDPIRFYSGVTVGVLIDRKALGEFHPGALTPEDEKRFLSLFAAELGAEMGGAEISISMAEDSAGGSTAHVQVPNGRATDGVAGKVWQVFDELREDTDTWAR
jgi:hypothetical protein